MPLQGEYDEAVLAFERAIAHSPALLVTYLNYGNALIELKQYNVRLGSTGGLPAHVPLQAGRNVYRRMLDIDPQNIQGLLNMGVAFHTEGKLKEAESTACISPEP